MRTMPLDDLSQLNRLCFYFKGLASSQKLAAKSLLARSCFSALSKFYGQAEWAISIRQLRVLPHFNSEPINLVVFQGPS
jgi:hypothetical protein